MKKLLFLLCFSVFFGCVNQRLSDNYQKLLDKQSEIDDNLILVLDKLIESTESEMGNGELDQEYGKKITKRLLDFTETIQEDKIRNDDLSEKLKGAKPSEKKKVIGQIDEFLEEKSSFSSELAQKVEVLEKAYAAENIQTFETAAFFPSGSYNIPDKYLFLVRGMFSDIFEKITDFSKVHNGVPTIAILNTRGFADEQGFNLESKFVRDAKVILGDSPDRQSLNLLLSNYRAEALGNVLQNSLKDKMEKLYQENINSVCITAEGRGEELPDPTVSDYKPIDERRRVVTVFWNVVPVDFIEE